MMSVTIVAVVSAGLIAFPEYWLYFLGAIFVVVTLFLPNGVVGLARKLRARR